VQHFLVDVANDHNMLGQRIEVALTPAADADGGDANVGGTGRE
jgi:hypothetical protein